MAARLVVLVDDDTRESLGISEVTQISDGEGACELIELEVDLSDYPQFDLEASTDRRALQRVVERFLEVRYE